MKFNTIFDGCICFPISYTVATRTVIKLGKNTDTNTKTFGTYCELLEATVDRSNAMYLIFLLTH